MLNVYGRGIYVRSFLASIYANFWPGILPVDYWSYGGFFFVYFYEAPDGLCYGI